MAAELSDMEAHNAQTPAEGKPPPITYRITAADTTPQSWVLERITHESGAPEQLILFDTQAEAQDVLNGFVSRKAP